MHGLRELRKVIDDANGEIELWVCNFKQESALKKARRHLKPIRVLARYTEAHKKVLSGEQERLEGKEDSIELIPYKKDGELDKKPISYNGGSLGTVDFFFDEDTCVKKYNDSIFEGIKVFENEKERVTNECNRSIEKLKESFVKTDYVMEILSRS